MDELSNLFAYMYLADLATLDLIIIEANRILDERRAWAVQSRETLAEVPAVNAHGWH
jgi:hypothetical protein